MSHDPTDPAAQDLRWMERIQAGDEDAFREFIEAHQHRIVSTVSKMLGGDSDAEDVAQQVFIRVWKSAPRWQPCPLLPCELVFLAMGFVGPEPHALFDQLGIELNQRQVVPLWYRSGVRCAKALKNSGLRLILVQRIHTLPSMMRQVSRHCL